VIINHVGAYCHTHVGAYRHTPLQINSQTNVYFKSPSKTIGAIVRGFKSAVTKQINQMRQTPGCHVWHWNYYKRIIRHYKELCSIRQYIFENPINWENDENFVE
jgi:hypothetical protein